MTAVAAGSNASYALRSNGTVWAWGYNGNGRLGDGTASQRLSPVQVPGLSNVLAIAAGADSGYALKNDGTLWAWGYNGYGELGDGTNTWRPAPVPVAQGQPAGDPVHQERPVQGPRQRPPATTKGRRRAGPVVP